jgi:signal transduction histidine kinase/ligand-binding sensor domain-containing protein
MTCILSRCRCLLWFVPVFAFLCSLYPAEALDPNRTSSQYVRAHWDNQNGLFGGSVHAIAQTPDGFLWVGTDKGLLRFDGFTFVAVPLPTGANSSQNPVLGLVTDIDGDLWVELQGAELFHEVNGRFKSVASTYPSHAPEISAVGKAAKGGVLVWDLSEGLWRARGDRSQDVAAAGGGLLPGASPVISIAETPDGTIWMGTLGGGLYSFLNGKVSGANSASTERKINCLLPLGDRELWVGTDNGLSRWNGTVLSKDGLPQDLNDVQILTMLRDRDANVWIGTAKGLYRINAKGATLFDERDVRGTGSISALFEDREGNIWVGGALGLERIRDTTFVTYSPNPSLSQSNGPVYVDDRNRAWFAPGDGGLYTVSNAQVDAVSGLALGADEIYSITGGRDHVWLGREHGGLTRLRFGSGGAPQVDDYTRSNGLAQDSVYTVYEDHQGALWAGTLNAGVSRFKDGRFTTFTTANGLASNTVTSIAETRDGTIWFGTPNGVSALANGQWKSYSVADGLPSNEVNCLFEGGADRLWIGTSKGIAYLRDGHVQVPPNEPDLLREDVFGIAEDQRRWLWIATADRVLRAERERLASGTLGTDGLREYGPADGLGSVQGVKRSRSVAGDSMGRIWISLSQGLAVVDPSHISADSPPAIAHVDSIAADGNSIGAGDSVHVPASPGRITFTFTGLSLAVPDRVRFRYFLEGFDRGWSDAVAEREAVYTNLGPGPYRFHVIASNSDGAWNGSEAILAFEVDPAYWQTWWFRTLCVLIAAGAIALGYRYRLYQLTRQMNVRFEERLAERTRIGRELHDTLLQSFQGLLLHFQSARNLLPGRPEQATESLDKALDRAEHAIVEARDAIHDIRAPAPVGGDLANEITALGEELAADDGAGESPTLRVLIEGTPRQIDPILHHEIYCIVREALRNAYRHARARTIEAEIAYDRAISRVRVRDDGVGIDAKMLGEAGRAGHWGLPGMRERARRIGAQLDVWSELGAGTEIELRIPDAAGTEHRVRN